MLTKTTEIYNLNHYYSQIMVNTARNSPIKIYNTPTNESLTQ